MVPEHWNRFYYQHDFFSMGERYVRCCSKEKAEHVFDGRVTDYLKPI